MVTPQPAILAPSGAHGFSLELDFVRGDAASAVRAIATTATARDVLGIGAPLATRLGCAVPGLRALEPHVGAASLAAAQHDLWLFVTADSAGEAFARAEALVGAAGGAFEVKEQCVTFRYRDTRDLTGYQDGLGNPEGEDAARAAIVLDGPLAGGSFAFVQRFVHDRAALWRLPEPEQDRVVGRTKAGGLELDDAPPTSHVKRTDQESFSPEIHLWRKSMPWGDLSRNGLQFIAFASAIDHVEAMLRRMTGMDDGVADALLRFTRAETGGYYYCPPEKGGLPDVGFLAR